MSISMRFTSDETGENRALRGILREVRSDLNTLKAGLGKTYADGVFDANPRKSPMPMKMPASAFKNNASGTVHVTTVWGAVTSPGATQDDPPIVEGYFAELLWDLSASDLDEERIKRRIAKRWNDLAEDAPGVNWKERFRGKRKAVGGVSYWTEVEAPVHGFAGVDGVEAEAQSDADLKRRRAARRAAKRARLRT